MLDAIMTEKSTAAQKHPAAGWKSGRNSLVCKANLIKEGTVRSAGQFTITIRHKKYTQKTRCEKLTANDLAAKLTFH